MLGSAGANLQHGLSLCYVRTGKKQKEVGGEIVGVKREGEGFSVDHSMPSSCAVKRWEKEKAHSDKWRGGLVLWRYGEGQG